MRRNTEDKTLYRNDIRKWQFLIQEYEAVKQKRHPQFRFVGDFSRFHQTHRQTVLKLAASGCRGAHGQGVGVRDLDAAV